MLDKEGISPLYIRRILDYDPSTGVFRWKPRTVDMYNSSKECASIICSRFNTRRAGKVAGRSSSERYLQIWIDGKLYMSHRLAWAYVTGSWPDGHIDHINGNKLDNSFKNLREADKSQNGANSKRRSTNTSGIKGVDWTGSQWRARIQKHGRQIHLGLFGDRQSAADAYARAAALYHGEFARIE